MARQLARCRRTSEIRPVRWRSRSSPTRLICPYGGYTMASIGNVAGTAVRALAFSALDKFDTLNSVVNTITGGRVNRDSLAQSVYQNAIHMGADFMQQHVQTSEAWKDHRHNADLVPHVRQALLNNDMESMKASVTILAERLAGDYLGADDASLAGRAKQIASSLAGSLAARMAEGYVGDHAGEKVLATMINKHG